MNDLARHLATLGGATVFCTCALLGLIRCYPPLEVLRKASLCALAFAVVAWLTTRIAASIARDALRDQELDSR